MVKESISLLNNFIRPVFIYKINNGNKVRILFFDWSTQPE